VPHGSHLVSLSSRSAEEKVASIGRVLGDRSVLYKYLNPHLLLVVTADSAQSSMTVYFIDKVSGVIVHELKHDNVDIAKGIHTEIVENVAYWSFHSTGAPGQSRGIRITVAELYESREKNERFNMYL
jgi:ER membrane protein complex subunit 1